MFVPRLRSERISFHWEFGINRSFGIAYGSRSSKPDLLEIRTGLALQRVQEALSSETSKYCMTLNASDLFVQIGEDLFSLVEAVGSPLVEVVPLAGQNTQQSARWNLYQIDVQVRWDDKREVRLSTMRTAPENAVPPGENAPATGTPTNPLAPSVPQPGGSTTTPGSTTPRSTTPTTPRSTLPGRSRLSQ